MAIDFFQKALKSLRPDTPDWYGWAETDSSGNRIPDNQRMCYEHTIVIQDGVTKPTQAEVDAEVKRLKDEHAATEYQRNRKLQYPDIGDQLDDLYKAGAFSDDMTAKIKAVKDKFPK
tara:strand:+ start:944 stop:1294 length:351 start_codon:yes stop_codon:yes gene_type:complete